MLLKESNAHRRSIHRGVTTAIKANWAASDRGDGHNGVEIQFDMGTAGKNEKLAVFIHNEDFELIARLMAEADREKAIQAFSKSLIKTKP